MASARTVVSKAGRRGKGMFVCCGMCGKQGGMRAGFKRVEVDGKEKEIPTFEVVTLVKKGEGYQCFGGCLK